MKPCLAPKAKFTRHESLIFELSVRLNELGKKLNRNKVINLTNTSSDFASKHHDFVENCNAIIQEIAQNKKEFAEIKLDRLEKTYEMFLIGDLVISHYDEKFR